MTGKHTHAARKSKVLILTKAAEAGAADAQFQLGLAYFFGDGVEEDEPTAALWYKRAAAQEHPEALYRYGNCLYFGSGVQKNVEEAFANYLRGANLGNLDCQYAAGVCYGSGQGIYQDWTLAHYWHQRAANHGHPAAQNAIGAYHMLGYGMPQNLDLAEEWLRKSAAKNHRDALLNLGYLFTQFPHRTDYLEAAYFYRKGADLGFPDCQYHLGSMISRKVIPGELENAIYWLRKAAIAGETSAYAELVRALRQSDPEHEEIEYWQCYASKHLERLDKLAVPPAVRRQMRLQEKKPKPPGKTESVQKIVPPPTEILP